MRGSLVRRWAFALFCFVGCSSRCEKAPPPAPVVGADPPARACTTAHDDALAKYTAWCNGEESCPKPIPSDAIGAGTRVADLDGDGVPEQLWGWGPMPIDTESHLYRGGPCAQHVLAYDGSAKVIPLATRHEGWTDIEVDDYSGCEGAMCGCTPAQSFFAFHDGEYREDKKRHVEGTARLGPDCDAAP